MQVLNLFAGLLFVFSLAPLAGLVTALGMGDGRSAEAFATICIIYFLLAGLILLANSGRRLALNRAELIPASILIWLVVGIAATPPYILLEGHSFIAAYFEAVSGITTLGYSLVPIDSMSWPMMVFRAMSSWLGGLLTLMLAIFILGRYEVGGTLSSDLGIVLRHKSDGRTSIRDTLWAVAIPYVLVTLLSILALMAARVLPGPALIAALSGISTGGLMPPSSGGSLFNNVAAESVLILIMITGAAGIINIRAIMERRFFKTRSHVELLQFIGVIVVVFVVLFALKWGENGAVEDALSAGFGLLFDLVSTITSTGIVHDSRIGVSISPVLLIGLALIGGCAFSTSGGIKLFRITQMFHRSYDEVRALIYPNRVLPVREENREVLNKRYFGIWSTFYATILFLLAFAFCLSWMGYDLMQALQLAVGSFTASAHLVDAVLFATETGTVSGLTLAMCGIVAILGRIEVLIFLVGFRLLLKN